MIPPRGYDLRQVPAYQLPRSLNLDLLRTPDRMWRSARAAGKIIDEVEAAGGGGVRRVRVGAGLPGRLAAGAAVGDPRGERASGGGQPDGDAVHPTPGASGSSTSASRCASLRHGRVVGVPLRRSIATLDRAARRAEARARFGLRQDAPVLFVFGASQGARSINLAMAGAAKAVTAAGIQVLHIIGARNEDVQIPPDLPMPYVTLQFLDEMELGYAAADLVISAGGRDHAVRSWRR